MKVVTKGGRQILNGVSGIALPGEMLALMGARCVESSLHPFEVKRFFIVSCSGAGKTTLLNTLLERNLTGLDVEGEVLVNGQKIGRGVTGVSAYVQQEDLFVGTLTVRLCWHV